MNVSFNWLKYYIDIDLTAEELAEKMTLAGIAVENIHYLGQGLEGVVTGKVVEIYKHPEADKLWICKIDVGQAELANIVTGADNVRQNSVVPVAVVGACLPNGMKMKKAKLRGVTSEGMLCSAGELNLDAKTLLPEQREGIFLLPADTPVGVDIKQVLGLDDVILEFELTANRADCFGVIGIAREAAALTGKALKNIPLAATTDKIVTKNQGLEIEIQNKQLCKRFSGRVLKGVKLDNSPSWLQKCLRSVGLRPINNIVDVTNFVMLELCQPMHAYDYSKIAGKKLVARLAEAGEQLQTLDEQERNLQSEMLVIADIEKVLGIAGVMGGLESEVGSTTKDIVLEAAYFNGTSVRKTSRALGLRSEASSRFERGTDLETTILAIARATQLLQDITTVEAVEDIVDCYPEVKEAVVLNVSVAKINARLGTDLSATKMREILIALGFGVEIISEELKIAVPSWRFDVTSMVDISEEIARVIGFDNIKATVPKGELVSAEQTLVTKLAEDLRNIMVANGLDEVINYSFIHPSAFDKLNLAKTDLKRTAIEITNPITDEFKILRTTLLASILQTVNYNVARRNEDLAIFEIGNIYLPEQLPLVKLPQERPVLAGAMTGKRFASHWQESKADFDFYDAKGLVTDLMHKFAVRDYQLVPSSLASLHPGKSADIIVAGQCVGSFGQVHPVVEENYSLNKPVYIFELDLTVLFATYENSASYCALPKYPYISRDLAVLVPEEILMADLEQLILAAGGKYLQDLKLFDVYQGKQVAAGFKSMAFTLTFQATDRTLTDKEVEEFTKQILESLQEKFNLKLRS